MEAENIFEEVMGEKFSNLMKSINHTDPRILNLSPRNIKKTTPRHIIIKLIKTSGKEKILKAKRENKTCHVQGNKDKDYSKFLTRHSIKLEENGGTSFIALKKPCQPRIFYPTKYL